MFTKSSIELSGDGNCCKFVMTASSSETPDFTPETRTKTMSDTRNILVEILKGRPCISSLPFTLGMFRYLAVGRMSGMMGVIILIL